MSKITKIDNNYYDLTNFDHPGGELAIKHIINRNGTVLFESHHSLHDQDKIRQILNKYKLPSDQHQQEQQLFEHEHTVPQFTYDSPFATELKREVKDYFKSRSTKAPLSRWILLFFIFLFKYWSLYLYITGNYLSILLMPLFCWLYDSNTFHDAAHFALSENQYINQFFSHICFQLTQPLDWIHQHNIGHHSYTNIAKKDPDLYHGVRLIRLHDSTLFKSHYHNQHRALLFIWSVAVNLGILIVNPLHMWIEKMYNSSVPLWRVTKTEFALYLLEKFIYLTFYIITPFLLFSPIKAVILVTTTRILYSFYFMINTQLTHIHKDCMVQDDCWYKHQVITATNHGIGSSLHFIFSAGLNYQIEHHLFPNVNQHHYPALHKIVKPLCQKYNIPYKQNNGYLDAFASYYNYIKDLGKK